jgi:hypothetical protein
MSPAGLLGPHAAPRESLQGRESQVTQHLQDLGPTDSKDSQSSRTDTKERALHGVGKLGEPSQRVGRSRHGRGSHPRPRLTTSKNRVRFGGNLPSDASLAGPHIGCRRPLHHGQWLGAGRHLSHDIEAESSVIRRTASRRSTRTDYRRDLKPARTSSE